MPEIPEKGDDTADITYAAVGYALSMWEFAEVELCWLFASLSGLSLGSREAIEIYSAQPTFVSRLGRLKTAGEANAVLSSDYRMSCAFHDLLRLADTRADERNRVAHGPQHGDSGVLPRSSLLQ
jgi:hypothetical protein